MPGTIPAHSRPRPRATSPLPWHCTTGGVHSVHMAATKARQGFFDPAQRQFTEALSKLAYSNPFLPERIDAEGAALGAEFTARDRVWNVRLDRDVLHPNLIRLSERVATLVEVLRERLAAGAAPSAA